MIICVTSQKGGVGKTVSAVSIATGIVEFDTNGYEYNPILVDLDPQGHAAIALGFDPSPALFLWYHSRGDQADWHQIGGCALVPGNSDTKRIDGDRLSLEYFLRYWSDHGGYSHTVFDTAAHGPLQEAAIAVANVIVIPTRPEYLAVDGVNATLSLVEQLNPAARTIILPADVDCRLREHKENLRLLEEAYPGRVAQTVPARSAVKEAVAAGATIWTHRNVALAPVRAGYRSLIREILEGRK